MSFTHRFDPTSLREYDIRGVVGVEHPIWIEAIVAFVEKRPGVDLSPAELRRHAREALRAAPDIATRLGALVIMGGRLGPESAIGEHNFNMDPEATAIVLASGAPIRLGTFEVTRDAVLGTDRKSVV